jgi:sirohydrochlorin cobaltochelatase
MSDDRRAIILFAHGARDPRWAEPFRRLRERVAAKSDRPVVLAFLELMTPTLDEAVDALVADGRTQLAVVPIFFGQGAHLRRDLPLLVDALRRRVVHATIDVAEAAGEDDAVLDALADYCVRASAP